MRNWGADWDGKIRFGLISDGVSSRLIYRAGADQPWGPAVDFGRDTVSAEIAGLDADNRTLLIFKPSPDGRKALYAFDLQDGKFSGALFQHKKYDVAAAVFSPKHRRLLGVRYNTEKPRQYWFAPDFGKLQDELDKANPSLVHEIVGMDWDVNKVLVFSHSAREPGTTP